VREALEARLVYYGAAKPPVRRGESHRTGQAEPVKRISFSKSGGSILWSYCRQEKSQERKRIKRSGCGGYIDMKVSAGISRNNMVSVSPRQASPRLAKKRKSPSSHPLISNNKCRCHLTAHRFDGYPKILSAFFQPVTFNR